MKRALFFLLSCCATMAMAQQSPNGKITVTPHGQTLAVRFQQQSVIEAQATSLLATDRDAAIRLLTNYSVNAGQDATARYRKLGEYLFVKYLDGNIKKEKDGKFMRNEYGTPSSPTFAGYTKEYYEMQAKGLDGSGQVLKVEEPVWLEEKDKAQH